MEALDLLQETQLPLKGLVILGVTNIPVYFGLGWVWFRDWNEFVECIRFWLTPDIVSAFHGEWADDWWAEMKLWFWFFSCVACVTLEAFLIMMYAAKPA